MYELDPVTLATSIIFTWGIGLAPPLIIRYALVKAPMDKWPAIGTCAFFWFFNIILFISLGSRSKTHNALILIAFVSYWILRKAGKANELVQHRAVVDLTSGDGATPLMGTATVGEKKKFQKLTFAGTNIDAEDKREWTFVTNPFRCKSEGMRRISIVLSAASVLAWFIFIWFESDGFTEVKPIGWLIVFAAPFGAYLLVMALRLLAMWIAAGFRKED